jgi:hypothetical protein
MAIHNNKVKTMMNLRWYKTELTRLPPESRKRLSNQLRRQLRIGSLPTKRQWRGLVEQALGGYQPVRI